ncbi:Thioredoxin-like [Pedobacter sp. ok626]|uniref:thioredoxin family protein n=1 Tax=Pedobacter sp. ok626 TaxID=1761882 RepID=UPI0008876185|nr:thioredoxin family protein [Pedobacter sp. ok626]SDL66208.1 Thioredoxin-like [Pedobacter sp. ok626]
MKRFLIVIIFYLFQLAVAEAQGIRFFEGSWNQALAKAKAEKKLVFLDCYTVWCAPCLEMAKETFSREDVGDFFNQHFVVVKIDMQKGEGPALKVRYAVNGYPTLMFINADGYAVSKRFGKQEAGPLLEWAKGVHSGEVEVSLEQAFNSGERSVDLIEKYFKMMITDMQFAKLDSVINLVVGEKGDSILFRKPFFDVLTFLSIDSRAVQFFTANHKSYADRYGVDLTYKKMSDIYISYKQLAKMYDTRPPRILLQDRYLAFIKDLKRRNIPFVDFMVAEVDFYIAIRDQDDAGLKAISESALKHAAGWQYLCLADFNINQSPIRNTTLAKRWLLLAMELADSEGFRNKVTELSQRYAGSNAEK